ncbi:MAG: nucleotidyl transferase AbiEii/AbiGii toxin family protein [Candidatus Omnitrophica bacterium]|nr:nucleotidyl transferase AbiEii/AbiGii toxin family protein [Candidatus Omnitrophota bacterium]
MLGIQILRQIADKQQTTLDNIVREYFQHVFLSELYRVKNSEKLLFKGGTALRIVYGSPRFSEDLDFNGSGVSVAQIEKMVESVLVKMEGQGIQPIIEESKKTSGGYLAVFRFSGNEYQGGIQTEVSLRTAAQNKGGSVALVQSDLLPAYTLYHLNEQDLVKEKVQACLIRGKARDFYDLYFILRSRMAFERVFGKDKTIKIKLAGAISKQRLNLKNELQKFLPVSQHILLKNFNQIILSELEKHLP